MKRSALAFLFASMMFSNHAFAQENAPPAPAPAPAPAATPVPAPWYTATQDASEDTQFAIGLFLGLAPRLKFNDVSTTVGGSTSTGEVEFSADPGLGVALEVRRLPRNSWGYQAGLIIEAERKIKDATVKSGGQTVSITYTDAPKYRSEVLYVNAVYRWDLFYLPFGLSYSIPHFTTASGATTSISVSGSVGAQLAAGFQFNPNWSLEIQSSAVGFNMKGTATSTSVDYKTGYASELRIAGKYGF